MDLVYLGMQWKLLRKNYEFEFNLTHFYNGIVISSRNLGIEKNQDQKDFLLFLFITIFH